MFAKGPRRSSVSLACHAFYRLTLATEDTVKTAYTHLADYKGMQFLQRSQGPRFTSLVYVQTSSALSRTGESHTRRTK